MKEMGRWRDWRWMDRPARGNLRQSTQLVIFTLNEFCLGMLLIGEGNGGDRLDMEEGRKKRYVVCGQCKWG